MSFPHPQPALEVDPSSSLARFLSGLRQYSKPGALTMSEANNLSLDIVEFMLDGCDRQFLKFVARFLTPELFDEIITERNIIHLCGYPLCNNDPKGMRQKHRINLRRPSMVLPSTYLSRYCCKEHYQASQFYRAQLSNEALFARDNITYLPFGAMFWERDIALLEEVLDKYSSEATAKSLSEVIAEFKELQVDEKQKINGNYNDEYTSISKLSNGISEVVISERGQKEIDEDNIHNLDDATDSSTQIDGYTPQGFKSTFGFSNRQTTSMNI